ncbi:MAG: CoA transferase [Dehalococcoidia bacterium]|nr:CoA transferase [Dehalococcoidia bacterium]
MNEGPLHGVRVLEIGGGIAAAYATRWMTGFGADVVRIEGPAGELTEDETTYLAAGKRRVDVDDSRLRDLTLQAEILVEDGKPGSLAARGLDIQALRRERPELVAVSITPFGQNGPYAQYEATPATSFAMGGIMSLTGHPSRPPLKNAGSQGFYLGGLNGFSAAVTAYYGALVQGEGDWIDISMQECAAGMLEIYGPGCEYTQSEPYKRSGNHVRAVWGIYPVRGRPCGRVLPRAAGEELLQRRRRPAIAGGTLPGPRAACGARRRAAGDPVWLVPAAHEAGDRGDGAKAPGAVRGRVHAERAPGERESAGARVLRPGGDGCRGSSFPGTALPGDTVGAAAAAEARRGYGHRVGRMARGGRAMKQLPLDGVRIADLTMMWAGPYATRLLAEMGAEVIKIESPSAWDNIRTLIPQPGEADPWNISYYFNDYNRDKKSLTLDLAQDRGRELFLELVKQCDVVIENYRADVLEKLGIDYPVLRQAREDIVLVSMAGFGKTGSEKEQVGFGPIIEQMAGAASLAGYGDGEPYKTGVSYGDPVGGIAAAGAVALGLIQRRKTGEGCHIDLAQRETMAAMAGEAFVAASVRGEEPVHRGNRDARFAPQGAYPCAGDDQWLVISVRNDEEWRSLAEVLGLSPQLTGLDTEQRHARHDELDQAIESWTSAMDPQEAMEQLQAAGVPAGRVLNTKDIHDDRHLEARGYWVYLPHPKMHPWRQPASSWRLVEANPAAAAARTALRRAQRGDTQGLAGHGRCRAGAPDGSGHHRGRADQSHRRITVGLAVGLRPSAVGGRVGPGCEIPRLVMWPACRPHPPARRAIGVRPSAVGRAMSTRVRSSGARVKPARRPHPPAPSPNWEKE